MAVGIGRRCSQGDLNQCPVIAQGRNINNIYYQTYVFSVLKLFLAFYKLYKTRITCQSKLLDNQITCINFEFFFHAASLNWYEHLSGANVLNNLTCILILIGFYRNRHLIRSDTVRFIGFDNKSSKPRDSVWTAL